MNLVQSIYHPFGINVFGSATLRVEPNIASLRFSVSRLAPRPKEAFQEVRIGTQKVGTFLTNAKIGEVSSSRITLDESRSYANGEYHFNGYLATVNYHILLNDLDRIEEILVGVVDAGVNNVASVDLQTTQLKEHRAETRRRAVQAAREKAENYCTIADVKLGPVLHIEDVNPDVLTERMGHTVRETKPDDEGPIRAINPGSIVVSAAVMIAYQLEA